MKIDIDCTFTAEVPDGTSDEEIAALTLQIPIERISIHHGGGSLDSAEILGYCTQTVEKQES